MKRLKIFISMYVIIFGNLFAAVGSTAQTAFGFGPAVFHLFGANPSFYLGANTQNFMDATNTGTFALVDSYPLNGSIIFESYAAPTAYVNFYSTQQLTQAEIENLKVTNPVYNNRIAFLSVRNAKPVIVLREDATLTSTNKICFVTDAEHLITTTERLWTTDLLSTASIGGLASSDSEIFAALLPPTGRPFGATGTSISVVITNTTRNVLEPVDATTGEVPGNKAVRIGFDPAVVADNKVAITNTAILGETIDMFYDIGRLFIALKVKATPVTGGCVSLLVGRIDNSDSTKPYKLVLEPVVPLTINFTANNKNYVIGYDQVNDFVTSTSLDKVRTMQTITGNSYLVVNGGVTSTSAKNKVYALPIVATSDTVANVGKLSKKNDFTTPATTAADLIDLSIQSDADKATVGGGDLPFDVQDIFVERDAVFVTGIGDGSEKSGIFQSTALFSDDGKIRKWSEWQRVMGNDDRVFTAGFNIYAGTLMYLTDNSSTTTNVIKSTLWGKGKDDGLLGDLVTLIASHFPDTFGGVQGLFDFAQTSSSLHPAGESESLSFMVATGYKKIALIETGGKNATADFTPNKGDFTSSTVVDTDGGAPTVGAGQRVLVISGGALDDLGPISSCDISRTVLAGVTNNGWLFVSGKNGVAVLSESNGDGWDTSQNVGLQRGFIGITNTMTFKKLGTISDVRKIVSDGTYLYVLTSSTLYRITLAAANFSTAGSLALPGLAIITTAAEVTGDTRGVFYDFIVSSKLGFLATSSGLFRVANGGNIAGALPVGFTDVTVSDGIRNYSLGPIVQLDLLSPRRGGFEIGGNLYVMAANLPVNLSTVYRFNVADTSVAAIGDSTVKKITESQGNMHYFALGTFRTFVKTDGVVIFTQNSKYFGDADFIRMSMLLPNLTASGMRGSAIALDIAGSYNTAFIARNSGSGAWMVPGDWGIRVNE